MDWVPRYLKPGMLAVDVGANAGDVTHHFLRTGARVIAIEPHAQMAQYLRDAHGDATVIEAAATDYDGTVTFHYSRACEHGSLYKVNLLDDIGRQADVPAVTLDTVCPDADVIKLDTQGAEAAILRGAQGILAKRTAVWYVELWKTGLEGAGDSVRGLRQAFEAHGYVPAGRTWDAVEADAQGQSGHAAHDILVIPQETA